MGELGNKWAWMSAMCVGRRGWAGGEEGSRQRKQNEKSVTEGWDLTRQGQERRREKWSVGWAGTMGKIGGSEIQGAKGAELSRWKRTRSTSRMAGEPMRWCSRVPA